MRRYGGQVELAAPQVNATLDRGHQSVGQKVEDGRAEWTRRGGSEPDPPNAVLGWIDARDQGREEFVAGQVDQFRPRMACHRGRNEWGALAIDPAEIETADVAEQDSTHRKHLLTAAWRFHAIRSTGLRLGWRAAPVPPRSAANRPSGGIRRDPASGDSISCWSLAELGGSHRRSPDATNARLASSPSRRFARASRWSFRSRRSTTGSTCLPTCCSM